MGRGEWVGRLEGPCLGRRGAGVCVGAVGEVGAGGDLAAARGPAHLAHLAHQGRRHHLAKVY